jgi:hypothetical protein
MRNRNMAKAKVSLYSDGVRGYIQGPVGTIISIKEDLKRLGFRFDPNSRQWWIKIPPTPEGVRDLEDKIDALFADVEETDRIEVDVKKLIRGRIQEEDLFLLRKALDKLSDNTSVRWGKGAGGDWVLAVEFPAGAEAKATKIVNEWVVETKKLRAPNAHLKPENALPEYEYVEFQVDDIEAEAAFMPDLGGLLLNGLERLGATLVFFDPSRNQISTAVQKGKEDAARGVFKNWMSDAFERGTVLAAEVYEEAGVRRPPGMIPSKNSYETTSTDNVSNRTAVELEDLYGKYPFGDYRKRGELMTLVPYMSEAHAQKYIRQYARYLATEESRQNSSAYMFKKMKGY